MTVLMAAPETEILSMSRRDTFVMQTRSTPLKLDHAIRSVAANSVFTRLLFTHGPVPHAPAQAPYRRDQLRVENRPQEHTFLLRVTLQHGAQSITNPCWRCISDVILWLSHL